ncbi:MAG: hypothetical protein RL748_3873 [Pseudomonadota bacterium]
MSNPSFLGTGWSFPPSFGDGGADVAMVAGNEDIVQSLQILLATRLGERVMKDDFGCDLSMLLFEEVDQGLVNNITRMITDAILYHEPRIELDDLTISESEQEPGLLMIAISYTVRNTNSRYNMVYPFYINEASVPAAN